MSFVHSVAVPFPDEYELQIERNVKVPGISSLGRDLLQSDEDQRLWDAAISGDADAVQAALDDGGNIEVALGEFPASPLNVASQEGYVAVVELLLMAGADVDAPRAVDGATAVFLAAQFGHADVVLVLIEGGADIDIPRFTDGATPLIVASGLGHEDAVEALITAGAKVEFGQASNGATALFLASQFGHASIVEMLLAAAAEIDQPTIAGATPLMVGSEKGRLAVVRALLQAGADATKVDSDEVTALHLASATLGEQSEVIATELLDAGAEIDAQQVDGWTPVIFASRLGNQGVVEILVERGADLLVEDNSGRAAADVVCDCLNDAGKENFIQCPGKACGAPDTASALEALLREAAAP